MSPLPRVALLALLASPAAAAADAHRNVVLADLGLHVLGVGVQRTVADWAVVQADLDYYRPWTQNKDFLGLSGKADKADVHGAVVRVRGIVFPYLEAPTGPWLSLFAQVGPAWDTLDGETVFGTAWATGVSAGWAFLATERLHLSAGLGVQLHAAELPGGSEGSSYKRPYPTIDLTAGYAF